MIGGCGSSSDASLHVVGMGVNRISMGYSPSFLSSALPRRPVTRSAGFFGGKPSMR